jgi:hypothetical protein
MIRIRACTSSDRVPDTVISFNGEKVDWRATKIVFFQENVGSFKKFIHFLSPVKIKICKTRKMLDNISILS